MSTLEREINYPIGVRIKDERERLGLSQSDFGKIVGATKKTVFSWENGRTAPDAFQLCRLAEVGLDLCYVLTGKRDNSRLAAEEAELLANYRQALEPARRAIRGAASASAEPYKDGGMFAR
ncbi:MAG: helix-turn-helix domain-containing protein [Azoarcus sp.]|jgi:transcriptional regulator with XRE-family HTH domain|nr:helix-turn-helix domain-containing protein [Azoarcus sp.]